MRYSRVTIQSLGYQLAPVVVTSDELEERIEPVYDALHLPAGQLEALTGIYERRWWEKEHSLAENAAIAGRKALDTAGMTGEDLGVLVYTGVNRADFEPATACHVASQLGVKGDASVYDICNACLGVINGIIDVANRIELGHIRAGLVVSCETAREINDVMIERMLAEPTMELFTRSFATLTGGSGAAAVLLTDGSFGDGGHQLVGGVSFSEPEHHALCRWGLVPTAQETLQPIMTTDAVNVLKYGVGLGERTWKGLMIELDWKTEDVDKVICHQVGQANRKTILSTIGVPEEKDFSTFPYLANMGTVSIPITAALAEERDFLQSGDRVGFLGIGSGLNCLMLGVEW